jgi:hypothetical protein
MGDEFVVKVQLPLGGNAGPSVLVYNEDRSVLWVDDDQATVAAVEEAVAGAPKSFMRATLDAAGRINLLGPAPWEEW